MIGVMQGRLSKQRSQLIQEFPWETWQTEFSLAKEIGLGLIEWTVDYSKMHENPIFLDKMRLVIDDLVRLSNVQIQSITLDNFVSAPLHKVNPKTRRISSIETLYWIIDQVLKSDIKTLIIPIVVENGGENLETLTELKKIIALGQKYLSKKNLQIALECELSTEKIEDLCESFKNFDNVGFNFDIGNSASLNNDPIQEINIYGDKLFNVHIKDRLIDGKTVPLGQGNANFKKVFKELKKVGYSKNYVLQAARIAEQDESITVKQYIDFCFTSGLIL